MNVVACQGNIADEAADALVSPADTQLSMSGGAASALRKAAGDSLAEAVAEQDTVAVGNAVLTPTADLFAEYVVHAVAKPALEPATEETVRAAVEQALSVVVEEGCDSVVFPLIGSGVGGVSSEESAKIILEEAAAVDGLEELRIITRSRRGYRETAALVDRWWDRVDR